VPVPAKSVVTVGPPLDAADALTTGRVTR
jgi:hypothetical protein